MDPGSTLGPEIQAGDVIDQKYLVEEILGRGGMGVVVAARHVDLDRQVAIKVLLPDFQNDHKFRARFDREGRAACRLRSQHVAKVLDVGILDTGAPYLVMERLVGSDLGLMLQREKMIEPRRAVGYIIQACDAIAEAHAAGIVHRDLKPGNLFITQSRTGGEVVKVLDFGMSKFLGAGSDQRLTNQVDLIGTPQFMSPEQLRSSHDVGSGTDIWALGTMLYVLISGLYPFDGKSVVSLCAKVMFEAHRPLSRPDLPPSLLAIINRCLEKDPSNRFPTATHLAQALRAVDWNQSFESFASTLQPAIVSQPASQPYPSSFPPPPPSSHPMPLPPPPLAVQRAVRRASILFPLALAMTVASITAAGTFAWMHQHHANAKVTAHRK